jgi:hypothetical protein
MYVKGRMISRKGRAMEVSMILDNLYSISLL